MKEKLISKSLYSKELNTLTASKVLSIKDLNGKIEIKYIKNGETKFLSILNTSDEEKSAFIFEELELPETLQDMQEFVYDNTDIFYKKEPHKELDEIEYIHNIYYNELYFYNPDKTAQELVIVANTAKDKKIKKFVLGFVKEDKNILEISSFELSNTFISKSLNSENLVIKIDFDDKYINYCKTVDSINEDKRISRLHSPNWCGIYNENSDTKIELAEDSMGFYISGVDFYILNKEHFLLFDDEDKRAFFDFVEVLLEYLRTLFINRVFKYKKTYEISGFENYEKFLDYFKQDGFLLEEVYLRYCDRGFLDISINKATKNSQIIKIVLAYYDWVLEEYGVIVEYDNKDLIENIVKITDDIKEKIYDK